MRKIVSLIILIVVCFYSTTYVHAEFSESAMEDMLRIEGYQSGPNYTVETALVGHPRVFNLSGEFIDPSGLFQGGLHMQSNSQHGTTSFIYATADLLHPIPPGEEMNYSWRTGTHFRTRAASTYDHNMSLDPRLLGGGEDIRLGVRFPAEPIWGSIAGTTIRGLLGDGRLGVLIEKENFTDELRVYINDAGVPGWLSETRTSSPALGPYEFFVTRSTVSIVPPLLRSIDDLEVPIGQSVSDVTELITATWGLSTHKMIPSDGVILPKLGTGWYHPNLSTNGTEFNRIGREEHFYHIFDDHSLDPAIPEDNTFLEVSRHVAVTTPAKPMLDITYGSEWAGVPYDVNELILPCGGEDGWTKYPLNFSVDSTVAGTYANVLKVPGLPDVRQQGSPATITDYNTQTDISGINVSGVLMDTIDYSVELSDINEKTVKIDTTEPIPNAIHNGGSSFIDTSEDLLSGMSDTRPSTIAFSTVGGGQPADSEFVAFENVSLVPGNYDVWVWATDKAGNKAIERVLQDVYIAGEVVLTKNTNLGAVLHTSTCANNASIVVEVDCEASCSNGTHAEITENTKITYQLRIENTDDSVSAKGDFVDYLPLGTELIGELSVELSNDEIVNIHTATKLTMGVNAGRWQIAGNYENLAAGDSFLIKITSRVPAYDTGASATNVISNQAMGTWELASSLTGTMESNYANHRVNPSPIIVKASNWGAAIHAESCTEASSLTLTEDCTSDCVAGNTGYVQKGDIITYQLIFDNPSNAIQYFATSGVAKNYDVLPTGVDATDQAFTILIEAGGVQRYQHTGVVASGSAGTIYNGTWPDSEGNYLNGLAVSGERIYQSAGMISVAPKSKLIVSVSAKVTGNVGDILTNQAITGHSIVGNNSNPLDIADDNVTTIHSNYVTHEIEEGTILRKWAYSTTDTANNPTLHEVGCPNFGEALVSSGCADCTQGSASLQRDNVLTYALTMDNTKNLHTAIALDGSIAGGATPGHYTRQTHTDILPEGMLPILDTLRVYVTDKTGNNVAISNGLGTSTMQMVNENGGGNLREVLTLGSAPISSVNILAGISNPAPAFALSNVNFVLTDARWRFETELMQYYKEGGHDTNGYSITYLFDATVTGEYDSEAVTNNNWVNHFKQDNLQRTHNPEVVSETLPEQLAILSNSVVHARLSDAVDTLFTKVAADDITQGLAGAEFALYKWEGSDPPTDAEANHMVDTSVLTDTASMSSGEWVRVKENAEVAVLTDVFVSAAMPLGEVDLGKLPTGTYTLIETKAPSGYEIPIGQWILTIDSEKNDGGEGEHKIEFTSKSHSMMPPAVAREMVGGEVTYKLINTRPFTIGLSGLGGTMGILLAGFILMTIAGNAYIVYSYKQKKKQK